MRLAQSGGRKCTLHIFLQELMYKKNTLIINTMKNPLYQWYLRIMDVTSLKMHSQEMGPKFILLLLSPFFRKGVLKHTDLEICPLWCRNLGFFLWLHQSIVQTSGLEWMTPGKRYSFSGGSRREHRRQRCCLALHKRGTAEKLTRTITSERVVDLWLPPLTHSDISPRRDYQCTPWWVWKRSAATIKFSHFCPTAPAADEADIILQTVANRICSFWIQIFPRLTDLSSSLLKMRHMWSKWMVRSWGIWMWFSKGKVFLEIFMWGHI